MVSESSIAAVQQSYGRCCLQVDFWDRFYDTFLKSSPEIAEKFKNTDFTKQKEIIKTSLNFVIMFAKDENNSFAKTKLESVGDIHSRGRVNIAPTMYKLWIDSLLATIAHYEGEKFTPELQQSWREILHPAIELLKSRY